MAPGGGRLSIKQAQVLAQDRARNPPRPEEVRADFTIRKKYRAAHDVRRAARFCAASSAARSAVGGAASFRRARVFQYYRLDHKFVTKFEFASNDLAFLLRDS